MNKIKFNKCLNIINFILWLFLLLSVIFAPTDIDLRFTCISLIFLVLVDICFDIFNNRDKRIRRKVTLEYVVSESDDKQGEE